MARYPEEQPHPETEPPTPRQSRQAASLWAIARVRESLARVQESRWGARVKEATTKSPSPTAVPPAQRRGDDQEERKERNEKSRKEGSQKGLAGEKLPDLRFSGSWGQKWRSSSFCRRAEGQQDSKSQPVRGKSPDSRNSSGRRDAKEVGTGVRTATSLVGSSAMFNLVGAKPSPT